MVVAVTATTALPPATTDVTVDMAASVTTTGALGSTTGLLVSMTGLLVSMTGRLGLTTAEAASTGAAMTGAAMTGAVMTGVTATTRGTATRSAVTGRSRRATRATVMRTVLLVRTAPLARMSVSLTKMSVPLTRRSVSLARKSARTRASVRPLVATKVLSSNSRNLADNPHRECIKKVDG